MSKDNKTIHCSFCDRPTEEVSSMIAGPGVYICDQCVSDAAGIVKGEKQELDNRAQAPRRERVLPPHEIKARLDEYVIGQHEAKKTLSVAVYNHYKRIESEQYVPEYQDVELDKSNILLVGPTGVGKTLLARTLARILEVPFCIADATVLTEAGYVGEDVESILTQLLHAADFDVERAERGIIYVDEIDKVARKADSASITRDVSGEGVQQALLKIFEGTVAGVPPKGGRKHPEQNLIHIDTRHILFICGGAFSGLEDVIERRINTGTMGFLSDEEDSKQNQRENILSHVQPEDLLHFGLIPELVGRLPVLTALNDLTKEDMKRILTEPRNALVKQYKKLLAMDGVELMFDEGTLDAIVDEAQHLGTGARGLRTVMEEIMIDAMYQVHSRQDVAACRITPHTVKQGGEPELIERKASA